MTLRDWLSNHADDLGATIFLSVIVAALVGFIKRSTGAAVFISCLASAMVVLIVFPWVSETWDWQHIVPVLGPLAGVCGLALFKVAMKFSDRLEERDAEIADDLINKGKSFIPGKGE